MSRNRKLIFAVSLLILAILACNFPSSQSNSQSNLAATITAQAALLQAQTSTLESSIKMEQAPTLAVETLQVELTSTDTSASTSMNDSSNPPASGPKNTKTPKPTKAPPSPTPAPAGINVFHFPITKLTAVFPVASKFVLDDSANAIHGQANLNKGFSPDPYKVSMAIGGNVNVSYLGSACSGFASSSPDLRINFGGGGSSLLRIYFIGANGDPAMVVNDPYGNFYCVDDSFGTVNPTIDFNNPAAGTYNVWGTSYASNTSISGNLFITENSGNHP